MDIIRGNHVIFNGADFEISGTFRATRAGFGAAADANTALTTLAGDTTNHWDIKNAAGTTRWGWDLDASGVNLRLYDVANNAQVMEFVAGSAPKVRFPDGTAALPSISFINDPDTGFYKTVGDAIRLGFAGAGAFYWDASIYQPLVDNTTQNGLSTHRWSAVHVGSFVAIGTNPASVGAIRLAHNQQIAGRNNLNTGDYTIALWGGAASDSLVLGDVAANLRLSTNLATPSNLANGQWWVECTGSSPSRVCAIKVQDGGSTRTIASLTY